MKQGVFAAVLMSLSAVVPSAAQSTPEWRPMHAAIASGMVAHGVDLGVSLYAFGRDPQRYREANPILRPLSDKPVAFGVAKMSLAVGVSYGLLRLHRNHPKIALVAAIAQTVAVGYVAHRNAQLLR